MDRPIFKVVQNGKKWGVKVKWPRSGPWSRTMLFPRYVWHGPLGNKHWRYDTVTDAISAMNTFEILALEVLKEQK